MYHPTTRLLTMLELLQTHEQMSSSELATRLEVGTRTVRRYILMLQDLGIPIEAEMGRHGGYTLRPGFKLPPMMFTNDEALALIVGLMTAQHLGLASTAQAVEGARAKLQRVLPEVVRGQTQALQSSVMFDFSTPAQQIQSAVLTALGQAAHDEQQIRIIYRTDNDETERVVDPYGVVYHDGWYLVGYCHLRTAMRIFRLDRMVEVRREAGKFSRPGDFNSLDYLLHSFAVMPDRWDVEVILKTTVEKAAQAIPVTMGLIERHPEGVYFRTSIANLDWMARFLVGLGCPLVVCQPAELRGALEKLAAEIAQFARMPQDELIR